MKIFIDSTWCIIYKWENGKTEELLLSGRNMSMSFQSIVDDILTPSQQEKYNTGNDIVYKLSKKKQKVLEDIINNS